jgi:hypothetical protein
MYSRFNTSTLDCIAALGPAVIRHLTWRDRNHPTKIGLQWCIPTADIREQTEQPDLVSNIDENSSIRLRTRQLLGPAPSLRTDGDSMRKSRSHDRALEAFRKGRWSRI